jgi:hypothetical protein
MGEATDAQERRKLREPFRRACRTNTCTGLRIAKLSSGLRAFSSHMSVLHRHK